MDNSILGASGWTPGPWRSRWPPVPAYRAISEAWKEVQRGLSPYGQRVAREVGQPKAMTQRTSPEVAWQQGRPAYIGYQQTGAPRGQQISAFGRAPWSLPRILAHELGHAMQDRTWGGTRYFTRPRQFYSQLTPSERLAYGPREPGSRHAQNPWELYARLAERPQQIRPELRQWYPQYWGWDRPEPVIPTPASASGYLPPSRVPLYGTGHYLNQQRQLLGTMGW